MRDILQLVRTTIAVRDTHASDTANLVMAAKTQHELGAVRSSVRNEVSVADGFTNLDVVLYLANARLMLSATCQDRLAAV